MGDPEAKLTNDVPTDDGLLNIVTGLGTKYDKNSYTHYVDKNDMDKNTVENLYRQDWVGAKAIDLPAKDMTRAWRSFDGMEQDELKKITKEERRLQ